MIVFLLVTAFLASPSVADAQDADAVTSAFDDATALLNEGRYEEALTRYEAIRTMGVFSAALWHNMGVAHYRLDNLGHAILYFERAARMDPEHEAIAHSLRVARERQVDAFSSLPRPFWRTTQAAVLDAVPPGAWLILGLTLLYGALALFLIRVFGGVRLPLGQSIHRLLPAVGATCVLIALSSSISPPRPEAAVIIAQEATLVEQADPAAPALQVVHEGLTVDIRARTPEWVLIQLSNGTRGWVPAPALESI